MLGQLLAGHYQVLQVLGAGGFGQTYIVEDMHLPGHPKCVLKHLKPTTGDPEVLATAGRLFQKEAETLQHLGNHEQIPRLLAYFEEKQEFYLVQEFISGHLLSREFIQGQKWNENQVIKMLLEILKILEFVHSHGVIHRDVKPDNIIRRASDNKLVLIDFGSIKQVRNQTVLAAGQKNRTIAIGTPGYMPSEQNRGMPRPNSDIFALGIMGIQALTGVSPQELQDDPNTGEIQWQHLTSVTSDLGVILTKMTHYHFKDRYQTVADVLEALLELTSVAEASANKSNGSTINVHELTLEWTEAGEIKTQTIVENQASKNPGKIRIGRDTVACDIVLDDVTVSALHVEIFFNRDRERFYLRNLRQRNPPVVDGQLLLAGEMALSVGSCIRLGQQSLRVNSITIEEYPNGYNLVDYLPQSETIAQQPIAKTEKPPIKPPDPMPTSVSPLRMSGLWPSPVKIPLLLATGAGMAVLVTAIAGFTLFEGGKFGTKAVVEQNLLSQQPEKCRIITPTGGNHSAKLRPEPQTEVGTMKQLLGGERVLFLRVQGEFVQIQDSSGTKGWLFGDQIQRCEQAIPVAPKAPTVSTLPAVRPVTPETSSVTSTSSSVNSTVSKNPDSPRKVRINKEYQEGFKQGATRGQELGKADGKVKDAKEAITNEICSPEKPRKPDYNRGFKQGCELAYKKAFHSIIGSNKQKTAPKATTQEGKQNKKQDVKPKCQDGANASNCQSSETSQSNKQGTQADQH